MKTYNINISVMSLAPQLNQDIIVNKVNVGRPINFVRLQSAIKKSFPMLSFPKIINASESVHFKRQLFSVEISSYRAIDLIIFSGISSELVSIEIKEVTTNE
jgi:hypothetical protein